jgi:phosphotransferase system  glucose/maltose/N-acetylglucosamine-specific IIC component
MEGVFGFIMVAGAIGTSSYYWITRGRNEEFLVGRIKTSFAFFFWYAFLVYLYFDRNRSATKQAETKEAKKRILG